MSIENATQFCGREEDAVDLLVLETIRCRIFYNMFVAVVGVTHLFNRVLLQTGSLLHFVMVYRYAERLSRIAKPCSSSRAYRLD